MWSGFHLWLQWCCPACKWDCKIFQIVILEICAVWKSFKIHVCSWIFWLSHSLVWYQCITVINLVVYKSTKLVQFYPACNLGALFRCRTYVMIKNFVFSTWRKGHIFILGCLYHLYLTKLLEHQFTSICIHSVYGQVGVLH